MCDLAWSPFLVLQDTITFFILLFLLGLAIFLTVKYLRAREKPAQNLLVVIAFWLVFFVAAFLFTYRPCSSPYDECIFSAGIGAPVMCENQQKEGRIVAVVINGLGKDLFLSSMEVEIWGVANGSCQPVCDRQNQFCGLSDDQGVWQREANRTLIIPCAFAKQYRPKTHVTINYTESDGLYTHVLLGDIAPLKNK